MLIKWENKEVAISYVDNCGTFTSFNQANLISEGCNEIVGGNQPI